MAGHRKAVLKWPGGKYRLLHAILPLLPPEGRLVEPFVGSGAVFLNAPHARCLLADVNPDVIAFHRALAGGGDVFIAACRRHFGGDANTPDKYYRRRDAFNRMKAGAARSALFLYLNRHCYNGLVRYNAAGGFNVPFGRYDRPYFPEAEMRAFLERAGAAETEFAVADFRELFKKIRRGDAVYCDPPYVPLSATANFTTYAAKGFGPADQEDLARLAARAAARGATVVVSNHDSAWTRELYRDAAELRFADVRRVISRDGGGRGMVREVLAVFR